MGQYYKIAVKTNDVVVYNDRRVNGFDDYIYAKLLEHSYFGNVLMDSLAGYLHRNKSRIAWIGDYAEEDEVAELTSGEASYSGCWNFEHQHEFERVNDFDYSGKFLVNHTKREYVSFDEYTGKAKDEWQLNPISILTAVGNGRGGGDFRSSDENMMSKVGSWAWDEISIDDEEPDGMEKLDVVFEEDERA